jgi:hypothetical protein
MKKEILSHFCHPEPPAKLLFILVILRLSPFKLQNSFSVEGPCSTSSFRSRAALSEHSPGLRHTPFLCIEQGRARIASPQNRVQRLSRDRGITLAKVVLIFPDSKI